MSDTLECRGARLAIGGEPQRLPADVARHVATCATCAKFRDETLAMEGRLKAALELPLHRFRQPAATNKSAPRRFALAASLLLAVLLGGGAWLFRPHSALAGELIEHVEHEPGSWQQRQPVSPEVLAAVLAKAGVRYDARLPVTYASPCPFRGRIVPHLVVQTDRGPLTVMVLAHVASDAEGVFSEGQYRGIVLPAGQGSIAVVARKGQEFDGDLKAVLEGLR
jgi:hypothetical protein